MCPSDGCGGVPVSRFFTEQPNPANVVVGQCCEYPCADIAAVDVQLSGLADRVRAATEYPKLLIKYRSDLDLLLDRRMYLEMCERATKE